MATEASGQRPERLVAPRGSLLPDVLRSEFTKLRTVRSTYATLATAFVAVAVLGPVLCALFASNYPHVDPEEKAAFEAIGSQGRGAGEGPFPHSPFNPCVRFSRTRLTDDLPGMSTRSLGSGWCP